MVMTFQYTESTKIQTINFYIAKHHVIVGTNALSKYHQFAKIT